MKTTIKDNLIITELVPQDSHVSFYGKARVISNPFVADYLQSYETIVASIEQVETEEGYKPVLRRHWDGWSATTGRHIASFCKLYGLPAISKKEWEKLPVSPCPDNILQPFNWKGVNVNYGLPYWMW